MAEDQAIRMCQERCNLGMPDRFHSMAAEHREFATGRSTFPCSDPGIFVFDKTDLATSSIGIRMQSHTRLGMQLPQ